MKCIHRPDSIIRNATCKQNKRKSKTDFINYTRTPDNVRYMYSVTFVAENKMANSVCCTTKLVVTPTATDNTSPLLFDQESGKCPSVLGDDLLPSLE